MTQHHSGGTPPKAPKPQPPLLDNTHCEPGSGCCENPAHVGRRDFLKVAGLGVLATTVGRPLSAMAGPFTPGDTSGGHLVPANKQLDPAWVKALFERGVKEVYRGKALAKIGMPCGGIGSGTLYLCGDGTLGMWEIFNNAQSRWVEGTGSTYRQGPIPKPVEQGFAVEVTTSDGKTGARKLDAASFEDVAFKGEYPIANITYDAPFFPASVRMEAFSPYIPMNAKDSGLPAAVFHITLKNTTDAPIEARAGSWLGNKVCFEYGHHMPLVRTTRFTKNGQAVTAMHGADKLPEPETDKEAPHRPDILFEDFEGNGWGEWVVEGDAFGDGPYPGSAPNQQVVSGFKDKKLVNSFVGGDIPTGRLISPKFPIERKFVNLLVGGGAYPEKTEVRLLINGEVMFRAMGENTEALRWVAWDVSEFEGATGQIVIVDQETGGWGHINVDHILFADQSRQGRPVDLGQARDHGSMAITCAEGDWEPASPMQPSAYDTGFQYAGDNHYPFPEEPKALVQGKARKIAPGEEATWTFVLSWHFPNQTNGQYYSNHFKNAEEVAAYILGNHERLTAETRLWRDTLYDSTLPYWLIDRLHSTMSILATGTCQRWESGRFYAFEGVTCCEGTCTHVWNYAHGHARLFPELARTIREMQDLHPVTDGGGFNEETGLVGFRSNAAYAADGQCGSVLKAYREHLGSADNSFLERNWAKIKKVLEYSIGRDENADGLIEDIQHNTFDINYYGANTFVGSLYLAALRAGEEMALEMGDAEFAQKARAILDKGSALTVERLWNGEYFIQDVDLKEHPQHQYKNGCLSDQVFGQGWSHQVGTGYIYPEEHVKSALQAVWKYNWAPDVGVYNDVYQPGRWFISPGQAGLFTCTWPQGDYLPEGTMYKNEVWTGIEYQAAGHMVWEGMVEEGLAICRAIHDRYQPELFNPYNEIECGDHYARAMASWGVYLALAGFYYHGPKGILGLAPRFQPADYRGVHTFAEGWGALAQKKEGAKAHITLEMKYGAVKLGTLLTPLHDKAALADGVQVSLDGGAVAASIREGGKGAEIVLESPIEVKAGQTLRVELPASIVLA